MPVGPQQAEQLIEAETSFEAVTIVGVLTFDDGTIRRVLWTEADTTKPIKKTDTSEDGH